MRYSLILFLIPIILFSKELTLSVALANALQSNQDLSLMEHDYQRLREAEQSSKLDFFGKVEAKVEMNHYSTPRTLMPLSPPINIHHLAKKLGIATVAEYVHSEAILSKVRIIGIDFVQGFHLDMPKSFKDFERVVI